MRTATEVAKMLEIDVNGIYALRNRIRRGYRPKPLTILAYRIAFNMPKEQLDFWLNSNAFDADFILKATKEAESIAKRGAKMTAEVLDNLRITRQIEIQSLKCDLLDLTGDDGKRMERVRRMRERLSFLSDCIESDYKEVSAVLKRRERELERQRIQAKISDLKAEIRELEARL